MTPSPCSSRENPNSCGFQGNSDLYGLGIRLRIYLQWIACLLANHFTTAVRDGLLDGYAIFTLALTIATIVLTTTSSCTFGIEIFLLLMLIFGEAWVVTLVPVFQIQEEKNWWRFMALILSYLAMLFYSCWFWFLGIKHPFKNTPCGSSGFLLTRISGSSFQPVLHLYRAISILAVVFYILLLVMELKHAWFHPDGNQPSPR